MKKLNVAVVGLSFGLEFVPIYLEHPDVEKVYLVDTDASLLHVAQNRYGIPEENCTCEIQEVLDDPDIDAVHLVTPPATHAPQNGRSSQHAYPAGSDGNVPAYLSACRTGISEHGCSDR